MTQRARLRAYGSLVAGIKELQKEWPTLECNDNRLGELIGFLFATLPIAEAALRADSDEEAATFGHG